MATTKKTSTASAAKTAAVPKAVPATAAAADSVDSSATDSVEARPPALKIRDNVKLMERVREAIPAGTLPELASRMEDLYP